MPERREPAPVVFFDIGGTLGRPRLSARPVRLLGIDVYPFVPGALEDLAARGIDLGIISNSGDETTESMRAHLEAAGIYRFFQPRLLIYSSVVGMAKDSPAIFELAAERAERTSHPRDCVYVGEDNVERAHAVAAGWRVAPHPILAGAVIDGDVLRFVRIIVPPHHRDTDWRALLRRLPLVPLNVTGGDITSVSAIVPQSVLATLAIAGFDVQTVGDAEDLATSDLYLLRDDLATSSGFLTGRGQVQNFFEGADAALLVGSSEQGAVVRIPADRTVEEFHFATASHGHNLKLMPDVGLLLEPVEGDARLVAERDLSTEEMSTVAQLTAATIRAHTDRYSGAAPLGDAPGTAISSRHILHSGNQRATEQLAADLDAIGGGAFAVRVHAFSHGGRGYYNVEAQLAGETDRLVLFTAHMDSTAASSPPYDPGNDPAAGADDDASGTAAVLAAAAAIRDLAAAAKPRHTIRFVLFNAEEHGLVGSHAYARDARAAGEQIEAVYQMDMIGYNKVPPATFELHAGYLASAAVQNSSLVLAERIARFAPLVAPGLGAAQVYRSNSSADRDPAEGRSDHAAFHQRGYPAVAATEDFFVGPDPSTTSEPNPNYHRKTDTFVDSEYAAGIARAVVAAGWVTASPKGATPPAGGTAALKIGTGTTSKGATDWKPYSGIGVYVDVDTSTCGFTKTPKYFTSIGGSSWHWLTTGATSIYSPTSTGFRIYVRWFNGNALTPETAHAHKWHIQWIGIEG